MPYASMRLLAHSSIFNIPLVKYVKIQRADIVLLTDTVARLSYRKCFLLVVYMYMCMVFMGSVMYRNSWAVTFMNTYTLTGDSLEVV